MIEKRGLDRKYLDLANRALVAKSGAYVLWGFSVGAAVLASDGEIYEGCNIESYVAGLGICAERCAIDHAILHGNKSIQIIAIVIDNEDCSIPTPCGVCLQYISDFSHGKAVVITARAEKEKLLIESMEVSPISKLLPFPLKSRFSEHCP